MPTISNQYSCKQNPGVTFWWVLCENGCSWPIPRTHSQDLHESSDCHGDYYLYQSGSGKHSPLRIMDGGTFIKNQQLPYTVIRWKESVETLLGLLRDSSEKPRWQPQKEEAGERWEVIAFAGIVCAVFSLLLGKAWGSCESAVEAKSGHGTEESGTTGTSPAYFHHCSDDCKWLSERMPLHLPPNLFYRDVSALD